MFQIEFTQKIKEKTVKPKLYSLLFRSITQQGAIFYLAVEAEYSKEDAEKKALEKLKTINQGFFSAGAQGTGWVLDNSVVLTIDQIADKFYDIQGQVKYVKDENIGNQNPAGGQGSPDIYLQDQRGNKTE